MAKGQQRSNREKKKPKKIDGKKSVVSANASPNRPAFSQGSANKSKSSGSG